MMTKWTKNQYPYLNHRIFIFCHKILSPWAKMSIFIDNAKIKGYVEKILCIFGKSKTDWKPQHKEIPFYEESPSKHYFLLFYGSCTSTLRYAQRLKDNSLIAAAKQIRAVRELDQHRFILWWGSLYYSTAPKFS